MHIFECPCEKGKFVFDGKELKCSACGKTRPIKVSNQPGKEGKGGQVGKKTAEMDWNRELKITITPGETLSLVKTAVDGSKTNIDWDFTTTTPEEKLITAIDVEVYYKTAIHKADY